MALSLLVLLAIVCSVRAAAVPVPVLAWSSLDIAAPARLQRSGHEVSLSDISSFFEKTVTDKAQGTVVLFIQDELSMADLTRFGGVHGESSCALQHIKTSYEAAKSAFGFPSVRSGHGGVAHALMTSLFEAAHAHGKPFYVPAAAISSFDFSGLQSDSLNVLVVELPAVSLGGVVSATQLAENDKLVGGLLAGIQQQLSGPLSVILTARGSDVKITQAHMSRRGVTFTPFAPTFPSFAQSIYFPSPLDVRYEKPYLYFTIPLFMGIIVFLIFLSFALSGVYGVSLTQTPERWADQTDKCLQVPAQ